MTGSSAAAVEVSAALAARSSPRQADVLQQHVHDRVQSLLLHAGDLHDPVVEHGQRRQVPAAPDALGQQRVKPFAPQQLGVPPLAQHPLEAAGVDKAALRMEVGRSIQDQPQRQRHRLWQFGRQPQIGRVQPSQQGGHVRLAKRRPTQQPMLDHESAGRDFTGHLEGGAGRCWRGQRRRGRRGRGGCRAGLCQRHRQPAAPQLQAAIAIEQHGVEAQIAMEHRRLVGIGQAIEQLVAAPHQVIQTEHDRLAGRGLEVGRRHVAHHIGKSVDHPGPAHGRQPGMLQPGGTLRLLCAAFTHHWGQHRPGSRQQPHRLARAGVERQPRDGEAAASERSEQSVITELAQHGRKNGWQNRQCGCGRHRCSVSHGGPVQEDRGTGRSGRSRCATD